MNPQHFQAQTNRLSDQFGHTAYGTDRRKILWKEVQDFSDAWFTKVVDKFIGEFRQAPLMAEFREEISRERERTHFSEKREHAQDAKDFFRCSYDAEGSRHICQYIIKRMRGDVKITDEHWDGFIRSLESIAKGAA